MAISPLFLVHAIAKAVPKFSFIFSAYNTIIKAPRQKQSMSSIRITLKLKKLRFLFRDILGSRPNVEQFMRRIKLSESSSLNVRSLAQLRSSE